MPCPHTLLLIAPHLHKLSLYTVPDYFAGALRRALAARIAAAGFTVLCSFDASLVAQIMVAWWHRA
ncbi:MAG: hypothetical protein IPK34_17085 [Ramlibacter sp.]|nr:hypothetical protein [Ramlibacter sp.]